MQELRLVAVSEDGSYLVLATAGRGTRFTLPVDDRLRAAIRGHFSRLGQFEIEVESPLRPKEIQARIRAGETAEEIAESAGIPVERVRWFEGPVLQEREYMAQQAQRCVMRTPGESTAGPPLGELVEERLGNRGADLEEVTWDAWKCEDNSWQIRLSFYDGGRPHAAEWKFDPRRRVVRALDDEAARLGSLTAEEPQVADIVTPLRRPAMKIVSDQRRDYPAGRPFAQPPQVPQPAPPAATPLNPEPFTPERFQREARAADFPDLEALSALLDGEPTVLPPPPGRDPGETPVARPSAVSLTPPGEPASAPTAPAPPSGEPAAQQAAGSVPQYTPADVSAERRPVEDEFERPAPRPVAEEPAESAVSAPSAASEDAGSPPSESAPQAPARPAPEEPAARQEAPAAPSPAAPAAREPAAKADPATAEDASATPAAFAGEPAPVAEIADGPAAPERPAPDERRSSPSVPEEPAARQEAPAAPSRPAPVEPEQPARAAEPPAAARPAPAEPAEQPSPPPAAEPAAARQAPSAAPAPVPVPEPRREPPKPKPAPVPAAAAAAAAPAKAEPRPRKRPARNRRASVPSWDEIMFGARRPD